MEAVFGERFMRIYGLPIINHEFQSKVQTCDLLYNIYIIGGIFKFSLLTWQGFIFYPIRRSWQVKKIGQKTVKKGSKKKVKVDEEEKKREKGEE